MGKVVRWVVVTEVLVKERHGPIAVLTLNRPERRNALNVALLTALADAFRALAGDSSIRALVLAGAPPAWCSGLDLGDLAAGDDPLLADEAVEVLRTMPQPSIAAIGGACVTGGLELALACDIRIASEHARFADTHARVGAHPGWGLTAALPRVAGPSLAREMSFTGNFVDATTALRAGLVSRIVEHERLVDQAVAIGEAVAGTEEITLRTVKRLYDDDEAFRAALAREREGFLAFRAGYDAARVAGRVDAVIQRGQNQVRS